METEGVGFEPTVGSDQVRQHKFLETVVTWLDWSLWIVAFAAKEQKYDGFHAAVRQHCSSSDSSAGHH